MPKEPLNLFSWVTNIKNNHDSSKPISAPQTTPSASRNNRKSIIFTRYFKGNEMPFHRPHGLVFKKNISRKLSGRSESTVATADIDCSCCAQGCCSSTDHHRHSTNSLVLDDNLDQDPSIHSCTNSMCQLNITPMNDRRLSDTNYLALRKQCDDIERRPSDDIERRPSDDIERRPSDDIERRPSDDIDRKTSEESERRPNEDSERNLSEDTEGKSSEDTEGRPSEDTEGRPSEDTEERPSEDIKRPSDDSEIRSSTMTERRPSAISERKLCELFELTGRRDSTSTLETIESQLSSDSERRASKDSSLIIPESLDSPITRYKRIKSDGDIVDYDDISQLDETDFTDSFELRSVICNTLIRLALNGPFQSPIETDKKQHVLHVGCGNGDWCMDIAKMFSQWLVVGIDDKSGAPIQDHRKAPKNFKYILCYYDILRSLADIPDNSFDLVYCRFLVFSYNDEKYMELIRECHRICKPGGFAEFYELDLRMYGNPAPGPVTYKFNSAVMKDMEQHNLNPRLARKLGEMVSTVFNKPSQEPKDDDSTNTKNLKKEHFNSNYTSLPLGVWGGRLGVMFRDDINEIFTSFEGHNEQRYETLGKEMQARKSFMNLHHVYAQKNAEDIDN